MNALATLALAVTLAYGTTTAPRRPVALDAELSPGHWFALVYHDSLHKVVLINGGPNRGGKSPAAPVELWGWDGARWSLLAADTVGPKWRNFAVATYDARRNRIVLHGGRQYATPFEDTWEWDGRKWQRFDAPGPGARVAAEGVYDRERHVSLLFGGNRGMDVLAEPWTWDGATWSPVSTSASPAPSPRGSMAMVYDEGSALTLLYGGHFPSASNPAGGTNYDEFWSWNGNRWQLLDNGSRSPGIRVNARAVYDTSARAIVFTGSGDNDDVWQWRDGKWSSLGSSGFGPRQGHGLAYDKARNRIVLFGGIETPGGPQRSDTWERDGIRWRCVAGCR